MIGLLLFFMIFTCFLIIGVIMAVIWADEGFIMGISIALGIFILITAILGGTVYGDKQQVELINKEFGTNYTLKEYFWAEETIEKLIEGQKYRIELEDN